MTAIVNHARRSGDRGAHLPTLGRSGTVAVALAALGTIAAILLQAPAVRTDAAYGLLAAMQHEAGRSPDIFTLREADGHDLTRDTARRVSQWAPSYQVVPYAFHRLGLGWGGAVRLTVLLAWACGAIGWALYFRAVLGPGARLGWLLALFLLARPSHDQAYAYTGGEGLEWGAFPAVLLVNLRAMTQRDGAKGLALAALAGALAGTLFVIRHGAAVAAAGLGATWAMGAVAGRLRWRPALAWGVGAGVVSAAIVAAGFPGGRTVVDIVYESPPWAWVWPLVAWPLALADLDSLLRWLRGWLGPLPVAEDGLLLASALVALVLLALAWQAAGRGAGTRSPELVRSAAAWTAVITLGTTVGLLAVLYGRGSAISFEGRHLRLGILPILPFLFERIEAASRAHRPARRWLAIAAFLLFFTVPAAFGAGSLVDKAVIRRARTVALVGPQGLRLDFLGPGVNARALYAELRARAPDPASVIVVPHPEEAFAVADRRLLVLRADRLPLAFLRTLAYHGRPPGGVVLVLPRALDQDGRRRAAQAAFRDVDRWEELGFDGTPAWVLWWGH